MRRCRRWAMMIGRVPPPVVSHPRSALRLACPAQPLAGFQRRRAAGAAARGRRSAPHQSPAPAGLGRAGRAGCTDPAPARKPAGAPAGHARHRPVMAPPPGQKQVDLPQPHRTTAGQRRDHRADRAPRHRKPRLGIPADPGRAPQARPPGRRVHDPPCPQSTEDPPAPKRHTDTTWRQLLHTRQRPCSPLTSSTWTAR